MIHSQRNTIVNFIWGIADDVLRDVYVRGMTAIRRLDCLLEPTDQTELFKQFTDNPGFKKSLSDANSSLTYSESS